MEPPGYTHPRPEEIHQGHIDRNVQRDTTCPVCASQLESLGEQLAAYGATSEKPVEFGNVVSFECGHRLHRDCAVQWINMANEPTCPLCRRLTAWTPRLEEQSSFRQVVSHGWKSLSSTQQTCFLWTWVLVAIVSITDPLGFLLVSSLLMMITPPFFFTPMAGFLYKLKGKLVSEDTIPGSRILIGVGFATVVSMLIVIANEEP